MTTPAELVDRYFALAHSTDRDAYVAQFAPDAVVEDDGRRHDGRAEIRAWRTEVPSVTHAVQSVESDADVHTATVTIAGDFPGSPVDLRFAFAFTADGRIAHLAIRP